MDTATCKNCVHFYQHYTLTQSRATPIDCGHCAFPRLKKRRPGTPACVHFSLRSSEGMLPDRTAVRDFLTVDILEYIKNLELPPEVEEI